MRSARGIPGRFEACSLDRASTKYERYRRHVDDAMSSLLPRVQPGDDLLPIIEIGLNHEQQHLELLLTDIKHLFSQNPLRPCLPRNNDPD